MIVYNAVVGHILKGLWIDNCWTVVCDSNDEHITSFEKIKCIFFFKIKKNNLDTNKVQKNWFYKL